MSAREDLLELQLSLPIPGLDAGWRVTAVQATRAECYVTVTSPDGWSRFSGLCLDWLSALQHALRNGYTYDGENPAFRDLPQPEDTTLKPLADYLTAIIEDQLIQRDGDPLPFYALPPKGDLLVLPVRARRLRSVDDAE